MFLADVPSLVLAVTTHVVKEFAVSLDELHNDSTTVTFCGAYAESTIAATSICVGGGRDLSHFAGHLRGWPAVVGGGRPPEKWRADGVAIRLE